jgi:hypothetical protein
VYIDQIDPGNPGSMLHREEVPINLRSCPSLTVSFIAPNWAILRRKVGKFPFRASVNVPHY